MRSAYTLINFIITAFQTELGEVEAINLKRQQVTSAATVRHCGGTSRPGSAKRTAPSSTFQPPAKRVAPLTGRGPGALSPQKRQSNVDKWYPPSKRLRSFRNPCISAVSCLVALLTLEFPPVQGHGSPK